MLSDGDFLASDWQDISFLLFPDAGPGESTSTVSRQTTGGNSGAFRQSFHDFVFGDTIYSGGLFSGELFDPANQGVIESIDFGIDLRHLDPGVTGWQLVIEQDGERFFSVPVQAVDQGDWRSFSLSGLTEQDFRTDAFATSVDTPAPSETPDFSVGGSPIQFGYVLGNSLDGGYPGQRVVNTLGVDNWQVTINQPYAPGDYNRDGTVDQLDLTVWTDALGTTVPPGSGADGNLDGQINAADYAIYRDVLVTSTAAQAQAATAVPEPAASVCLLLATLGWVNRRPTRRVPARLVACFAESR